MCNYTSKQQALLEAKGEGTKQTRKYIRGSTSSSTGRRRWRHSSIPSSIPSYIPSSIPSSSITPPPRPPFPSSVQCPVSSSAFFYWWEIPAKREIKFIYKKKWSDFFEVFKIARFYLFIYLFSFHCVAKSIKGWLGFCSSYMVYSHIWLNLRMDDPHFFYNFLLMITSLAKKQKKKEKKRRFSYICIIFLWRKRETLMKVTHCGMGLSPIPPSSSMSCCSVRW